MSWGSFDALLALEPGRAPAGAPFTADERAALADAAARVALGPEALAACQALRRHLAESGVAVSDRRWRQWIGLLRVAAAAEGRAEIDALDLWTAPYVVAAQPQEVPQLATWFEAELLGAVPQAAPWLGHAVVAFEQQLEIEQSAPTDVEGQDAAGKLALMRAVAGPAAADAMPRMMSEQLERHARRRYSPVHVAARVAQLDEVLADANARHAELAAAAARLAAALRGRVWMPPSLVARLQDAHAQSLATLQGLLQRLQACRAGFAALPLDEQLPAVAPAALDLALAAP